MRLSHSYRVLAQSDSLEHETISVFLFQCHQTWQSQISHWSEEGPRHESTISRAPCHQEHAFRYFQCFQERDIGPVLSQKGKQQALCLVDVAVQRGKK